MPNEAEEVSEKKKKRVQLLKSAGENLVRFAFSLLFVSVYQLLFGVENTLAGVAISVAITMLPVCDTGVRPISMAGMIVLLFAGCGLVSQLALVSPWLALPVNFCFVLLIMALCSEPPQIKLYINFMLGFVFCQATPVPMELFGRRMLGLLTGSTLVAVVSLAGCGSNAVQEIPRAGTSRAEEATPETAAPEVSATPTPTPEPTPAVVVPTSVTLEQEGGILNNGMTWTLHATVLPEDAADKTLTWTSADESVATIDDSGVITTHAPGQTTITAASTAGGVSTTYNLVVQEVVKCSYCGGTGHTADTCAVKKTAEQQAAAVAVQQQAAAQAAEQAAAAQAAEQPAAEAAQPADPGYAVTAKGDRIYPEGSPDIPEGGVVQRPDGTFYVKGPRNVIFGYEEGEPDPNMPPWTGDCVFCGDFGHDVYHCPILDAQENPDAFLMD